MLEKAHKINEERFSEKLGAKKLKANIPENPLT